MELTVYRQSSKTRPDGTIVYKGEDARPYVDEKLFFVADGLGGAAAIRHQKVNPDLFDQEKLLDTLFKGVFAEYSDERFTKYVEDSFFELFAVKDCYTDNINNIKKSGYFASRIVSAILLHEMIYKPNLQPKMLFEVFHALGDDETREEFKEKLGTGFATLIREKLKKIAENANLIYESSYSGLALLGTTLCATIYQETDEAVEAFYLTAGDSRPYVWTEQEGLCQLIQDQEGKDGGMTNYIKANEDQSFEIRCDYMSFTKPCVLFNASDGCFDSGYFLSQMAFEKLILEKAIEADSEKSMGESIHDIFLTYGRHDDSSTIAMKMFGYESFEDFQKCAGSRLAVLESEYLSKMPDLLSTDFITEYQEVAAKLPAKLAVLKDRFEKEEAVLDYCEKQVLAGKYSGFEDKLRVIDNEIASVTQQIDSSKKKLSALISRNYVDFYSLFPHKETWSEKRSLNKILTITEKHKKQVEEYLRLIDGYKSRFEKATRQLGTSLEQLFAIGVPSDYTDFTAVNYNAIRESDENIYSLVEFFNLVKKKNQPFITRIVQLRNDYVLENQRLAAGRAEDIETILEQLLSEELKASIIESTILRNDVRGIENEVVRIHEAEDRIHALEKDEKSNLVKDCRKAYWNENSVAVIREIADNPEITITKELRAETQQILEEMRAETDTLKQKADLQAELFEKYDAGYTHYMEE